MSVTAVPIRPLARGSVLKLWIGLLVLALGAAALAWVGTAGQQVTTTSSGLRYRVIEEGTGPTVTPADLVALRYKLRKEDGTLIQDSDETGQPFVTGTEGVFPGFSEGLQLMQAGGRYVLWLPPGLHVQQPMPPGAPFTPEDTLVFEIEVMQIAPGMAAMQQMMGPPGGGPGGPPSGAGPEGAGPGGAPGGPPPEAGPQGGAPDAGGQAPNGNGQ
ncbi:MAG: FKBP-type peptidyl-prolyl cis-trans isomerase [Allosphingosinicella sp.]